MPAKGFKIRLRARDLDDIAQLNCYARIPAETFVVGTSFFALLQDFINSIPATDTDYIYRNLPFVDFINKPISHGPKLYLKVVLISGNSRCIDMRVFKSSL